MTTDHAHDEDVARHAFDRLVTGEPASGLDPAASVRQGRRIRRQHRARVMLPGVALGVVGVTALAVSTLGGNGTGTDSIGRVPAPEVSFVAASAPLTEAGREAVTYSKQVDPDTGDVGYVIDPHPVLQVLRDALGEDVSIAVARSSWGSWDATVMSGGQQRGGVSFAVTDEPGMLTVNPCGDSEFVAGGTCTRTVLADGSYLNERGVVDDDGLKSIVVSITRDDGTGVFVEANNFVWGDEPAPRASLSAEDKALIRPDVVADSPALTVAQARSLVKAVERSGDIETFPRRS